MENYIYKTELDGMKTILTNTIIKDDEYVFIEDKIYVNDNTFFKNKKTKNDNADLKLVKLAEIFAVSEEDLSKYKLNQLYSFEGSLFTSVNRLNKGQVLRINSAFYTIQDILKEKGQAMKLEVSKVEYLKATNMYTILARKHGTSEENVYDRYPSYGEALTALWKLREKRDGHYYRFA